MACDPPAAPLAHRAEPGRSYRQAQRPDRLARQLPPPPLAGVNLTAAARTSALACPTRRRRPRLRPSDPRRCRAPSRTGRRSCRGSPIGPRSCRRDRAEVAGIVAGDIFGGDRQAMCGGDHAVAPGGQNRARLPIEAQDRAVAAVKDEDVTVRIDADAAHLTRGEALRILGSAVDDLVGRFLRLAENAWREERAGGEQQKDSHRRPRCGYRRTAARRLRASAAQ